jgi:hypothetical protein
MTITALRPLAAGNALRVFLQPPAGALAWRIVRKATNDISGLSDPGAALVYDGDDIAPLDYSVPTNGVTFYYQAFYWDGTTWTPSNALSGQAAATYSDGTIDVLELVRERLDFGMQAEIAAQRLVPQSGIIEVLTAPPVWENTKWPVVTVHMQSDSSQGRALGEVIEPDEQVDGGTGWDEIEGWLCRVQLAIVGWSQNPDERIELRKAVRRIVVANLAVFDAAGMVQIDTTQQDIDMVNGEYPAPVYQTLCTLTCQAPVRVVTGHDDPVTDVTVTATATNLSPGESP